MVHCAAPPATFWRVFVPGGPLCDTTGHTFLSYRAKRVYLREQKRHKMLTDDGLMGVGEQKWPLVLTEIGFAMSAEGKVKA